MLNAMIAIIAAFAAVQLFRLINGAEEGDNAGTHFQYKRELQTKQNIQL